MLRTGWHTVSLQEVSALIPQTLYHGFMEGEEALPPALSFCPPLSTESSPRPEAHGFLKLLSPDLLGQKHKVDKSV